MPPKEIVLSSLVLSLTPRALHLENLIDDDEEEEVPTASSEDDVQKKPMLLLTVSDGSNLFHGFTSTVARMKQIKKESSGKGKGKDAASVSSMDQILMQLECDGCRLVGSEELCEHVLRTKAVQILMRISSKSSTFREYRINSEALAKSELLSTPIDSSPTESSKGRSAVVVHPIDGRRSVSPAVDRISLRENSVIATSDDSPRSPQYTRENGDEEIHRGDNSSPEGDAAQSKRAHGVKQRFTHAVAFEFVSDVMTNVLGASLY